MPNKCNIQQKIILNENTEINYYKNINNENECNKFIINDKNNNIIIKFCETELDYNIFVCFKDKKQEKLNENELFLTNSSCQNESYPAYKYIKLIFADGTVKELENYIDLDEKEILDEIFFIIYHTNHFKNNDILKSFEIITPLIKPFINDFINKNKSLQIKKLV